MADSTVSVLMTAEESRLHQAVMNAAAAFAYLDTGVAKVARSSREAAKEEEALGRAAKRVFDETRTPQEQYNARMEKLNALVKAGVTDQETFRRAAQKAGDELKAAGGAGVQAFGSNAIGMVKEFAGALGIGFGLAGAIQVVKAEWEAVVEVQNRALEATTTNAAAQRKFRAAAGFESKEEAKQFDEQIEKMAEATGVQGKELYLDAAKAFAVRHGQSKETAMQAVGTAAELFPADAGKRQEFTQAVLGVTQATGMNQRQAAGWLLASAQRSGMAPPDIAPLINALPGEDPRQVMAVSQAVGASMGMDPTKPVLSLMQKLGGDLPEEAGDTTEQRLAYTAAHPELVDDIVKKMELRGPKAKTAVRQLLSGEGATYEMFRQASAAGISPTDSTAALDKQIGIMGEGGNQLVDNFERRWKQVRDQHEESGSAANTFRAIKAAVRKDMTLLLTDLGEGALLTKLGNLGPEASGDFIQSQQTRLRNRARELRLPKDGSVGGLGGIYSSQPTTPRPASEDELDRADTADKAAALLGLIHEELKKMNDAQNRPKTRTLGRPDSRN